MRMVNVVMWAMAVCMGIVLMNAGLADGSQLVQQVSASSVIGKVIAVRGDVRAVGLKGAVRDLKRGSPFYVGDKIVTYKKASTKIRFVDGTLNSLRPNTVLYVKNFKYEKNGKHNSGVFELVKGGLKLITGVINKNNPDAYKIETPAGVIGVRGTILEIWLVDRNLYGILTSGTAVVQNLYGRVFQLSGTDANNAFMLNVNGEFKKTSEQTVRESPCG